MSTGADALDATWWRKPVPEARQRKVIHVDMDAFFASVEQRDNPELRGKPVAVGYSGERGVVAAASYEARAFGVRSAMPSLGARRKCPELIFVPPRFEAYRAVSQQIRAIFAEHTPVIEPLSLDEAYLDVTTNLQDIPLATEIARVIRAKIRSETGLTASAGISYNKFLAKLASSQRKPDGQYVITPSMGPAFVEALAIERFHGVGPATASKMHRLGIRNGLNLKEKPLALLTQHFGKSGRFFFSIARGIDERPVDAEQIRKSAGVEDTFSADIHDLESARRELGVLAAKLWRFCEKSGVRGRAATLKVKYADFRVITRSRTLPVPVASLAELETLGIALLTPLFPADRGIRLLGLTVSSLGTVDTHEEAQLPLLA